MGRLRNFCLVGAITGVAVVARFYGIHHTPPGLHFDEAFEAVQAIDVLHGRGYPVFFEGNFGVEPTFIYLVALFFRFFGVTHLAGRLVASAIGALTVPAVYFLTREIYRGQEGERWANRLALLSSLTLAVLFWHVHFSRLGIEPILVPLNAVFVLFFLWRAIKTGRMWAFAACGAAIGFGPYTYPAGRMLPLLALAVGLHALAARSPEHPFLSRRAIQKIAVGLLAALLVLLPLVSYFVAHPQLLMQRMGQVSVAGEGQGSARPLESIASNLWATVRMVNLVGDQDPRNNLPGRPVLDIAWSVLFAVGGLVCLARIRRPEYGLPLWWLLTMLAPTVLSEHAPHFRRALGASPAVALLVAIGSVWMLQVAGTWTRRVDHSLRRRSRAPVIAAGVLVAALWLYGSANSMWDYFGRWSRLPALYYAFDVGLKDIAEWMREPAAGASAVPLPGQAGPPDGGVCHGRGRPSKDIRWPAMPGPPAKGRGWSLGEPDRRGQRFGRRAAAAGSRAAGGSAVHRLGRRAVCDRMVDPGRRPSRRPPNPGGCRGGQRNLADRLGSVAGSGRTGRLDYDPALLASPGNARPGLYGLRSPSWRDQSEHGRPAVGAGGRAAGEGQLSDWTLVSRRNRHRRIPAASPHLGSRRRILPRGRHVSARDPAAASGRSVWNACEGFSRVGHNSSRPLAMIRYPSWHAIEGSLRVTRRLPAGRQALISSAASSRYWEKHESVYWPVRSGW